MFRNSNRQNKCVAAPLTAYILTVPNSVAHKIHPISHDPKHLPQLVHLPWMLFCSHLLSATSSSAKSSFLAKTYSDPSSHSRLGYLPLCTIKLLCPSSRGGNCSHFPLPIPSHSVLNIMLQTMNVLRLEFCLSVAGQYQTLKIFLWNQLND